MVNHAVFVAANKLVGAMAARVMPEHDPIRHQHELVCQSELFPGLRVEQYGPAYLVMNGERLVAAKDDETRAREILGEEEGRMANPENS